MLVACVGGGSNAMGLFHPFLNDESVDMAGIEAAGHGLATNRHAAPLSAGSPGVLHGQRTYLMQTADGQIMNTHSVSAGLDYPGVGPEHAHLKDLGRVRYAAATDDDAVAAFRTLNRAEGILPALESSHALAWAMAEAARRPREDIIIVNLSGRGDKDVRVIERIDERAPS